MEDAAIPPSGDAEPARRCDFCGLPCPPSPVTLERDEELYECCSTICRDALASEGDLTTVFQGFRRFTPSTPILETPLPAGLLRNSFTLVSSTPGTGADALLVELVWDTLQQGGSAVVVAYREPPISILEEFLALGWNVIPYLESRQLHLVDCVTYRVAEPGRMQNRLDRWNQHVARAADPVTRLVRDPTDLRCIHNQLDDCIESGGMRDDGIVVFDSLTEIGSLVPPVKAYNFVKDLRADVVKGRFVPVFAHATFRDEEEFPHDLSYMMDGIIELRFADEVESSDPTKRLRVRKMRGVPSSTGWTPYEYDASRGLVEMEPAEGHSG